MNLQHGTRVLFVLFSCQLMASCSSSPKPRNARAIEVAAFAEPREARPRDGGNTEAAETVSSVSTATTSESARAGEVVVTPDRAVPSRGSRPGDRVIVESVVGQVSGKPIFADDFFEPIADRLRASAAAKSAREFISEADAVVRERLQQVIISELYLSEAESALTQEQQMGLFAFLRDMQSREIAERGGTQMGGREAIRAETDLTLDQYMELQRNRALIQNLIQEKIKPRVLVSWKDVQREYQKRRGEFNPPATVTLARIRLSGSSLDRADEVKTRLASGEGFATIANDLGSTDGGLWDAFVMGPGGVSDIEVTEDFRTALKGLSVGQTSPPIELQSASRSGDAGAPARSITWLHVVSVDQPPGRTVYDLQRELTDALTARRSQEEQNRYTEALLSRGIYDEVDAMAERLLEIAVQRYGRS